MESIRHVLRESLAKSLEHLSPLDRLSAAWPVVAGHSIATRSAVVALDNGACRVEVEAAWLAQLESMSEILRSQLQQVARVQLRALHFQQKP